VYTINRHENRPLFYSLPKTGTAPEKFGTKLHVRRSKNWYRFSGTGFRRRFLVRVSLALTSVVIFALAAMVYFAKALSDTVNDNYDDDDDD